MTATCSQRHRLITVIGLLLLIASMTPLGVAAQNGVSNQVAQPDEASFIEVHVSECAPGSPSDAAQLKNLCHEDGLAGVNLAVTSTNPDLGVNLPNKVTVRENNAGPGIINTGDQPLGEYRIQVDLPVDANSFVFHCELRESDTVVPTTPDPSGAANVFLVTTTGEDDVVCDVYVTKAGEQPSIVVTYRECSRADLAGDGRTFEDLDPNCTTVSADPPTFNVRALNETGQPVTQHELAADGTFRFDLPAGSYDLFTDLDMDSWGEYLFCEYPGQPRYQKEFNPERGIVTFSDLVDEQITCDWFAVNAAGAPVANPTEQMTPPPVVDDATATVTPAPATEVPTQAPTNIPVPPTEVPTQAASQVDGQAAPGIQFTYMGCMSEEEIGDTSSRDALQAGCPGPVQDVVINLTNDSGTDLNTITDAAGTGAFSDLTAGNWRMWSEIPLESATEYYFCNLGDGAYSAQTLSDRGVASFAVADGQAITCEVYVVPENLRGDVTGASVEVHLSACPVDYAGSNWYNDCHDTGVVDLPFTLTGPGGESTLNTVVERTPGPGIVTFTELPAGDYVLSGGPPQDTGTVFLYCSDPANGNAQVETTFENGVGSFTLVENQSITCDWYFVPENMSGQTPTPTVTPAPKTSEIFTTMFVCPESVNVAGSTFSQLDSQCSETVNDVPMNLQRPGGVPISANTGASGDGAVRFFDLTGGDYVLTPTLPENFVSAAVYCDLNHGDVYQKALTNGGTTFVNVEGELISCSWFVAAKPAPQQGPTGSITIREMLCTADRASIKDWERECQPGASGVTFTVKSVDGTVTQTQTPNAQGVVVFSGLPDQNYAVTQSNGMWCRAQAERVDSQSRVGVSGGGNTDVFIYQCNQQLGLPSTGSGPVSHDPSLRTPLGMVIAALPFFATVGWYIRRTRAEAVALAPVSTCKSASRTARGYRYR